MWYLGAILGSERQWAVAGLWLWWWRSQALGGFHRPLLTDLEVPHQSPMRFLVSQSLAQYPGSRDGHFSHLAEHRWMHLPLPAMDRTRHPADRTLCCHDDGRARLISHSIVYIRYHPQSYPSERLMARKATLQWLISTEFEAWLIASRCVTSEFSRIWHWGGRSSYSRGVEGARKQGSFRETSLPMAGFQTSGAAWSCTISIRCII